MLILSLNNSKILLRLLWKITKKWKKKVEQVVVNSFRKINPKGKKWAGVYHSRQS